MFAQLAGAQVDRAVSGVEQPRVGIELVRLDDHGPLGFGELHRGAKPGFGLARERPLDHLLAHIRVVVLEPRVVDAADGQLRSADRFAVGVSLPAASVPGEPAETGRVAEVAAVFGDEPFGVAEVGQPELASGDAFGDEKIEVRLRHAAAPSACDPGFRIAPSTCTSTRWRSTGGSQ
jgi:hypothetical protein